jgi:hypothetical protein
MALSSPSESPSGLSSPETARDLGGVFAPRLGPDPDPGPDPDNILPDGKGIGVATDALRIHKNDTTPHHTPAAHNRAGKVRTIELLKQSTPAQQQAKLI